MVGGCGSAKGISPRKVRSDQKLERCEGVSHVQEKGAPCRGNHQGYCLKVGVCLVVFGIAKKLVVMK